MAKAIKTREIVVKRPVKYNVDHREKSVRVSVQLPQSIYEKITKDKDGNEQTVREWILSVTGYEKQSIANLGPIAKNIPITFLRVVIDSSIERLGHT